MRLWLKQLREKNGLTEREMAERLALELEFYRGIENGTTSSDIPIPVIIASQIADIFDIPLSKQVIYENNYLENK